ncbi:MAG: aldehyde dehydrogenase family protein, partial [Rhizobiales bacterium]|nr:aldehyde dehydrogenase family protein [Hyphomicrobiales bacterium]
MREIGHYVGGKVVKGQSGRFGDIFNPNTGEVQAKVALASKADVESAIANAAAAQPAWAATNPQRRARVLFKFLELVQKEMESLAKLLSSEHGKVLADSKGDIQRGVEVVEFACGNAFILKPSERDPSVPMRLAELLVEAGLPAGVLNVVNGDKEAVDT